MLLEKQLILAQLRFFCQPDGEDEIAGLLSEGVDWGRYLDMCEAHGLEGAAYYVFKKLRLTGSLPGEVMDYLQWKYYQIAARNIYLMDQLRQVVAAFEQAGLSLLPIQGASLVEAVYPSLGTRPMNDVDLLIREGEWPQGRMLLRKLEFHPLPYHPTFFSNGSVVLDIHFDLANLSRIRSLRYAVRINNDKIWAEAAPLPDFRGGKTLSLSDTILYLAVHLQKHYFSRLIWFLDIALLVQQHREIDWPALMERAREFNLTKPLCFVLCYLKSVLEIRLPEGIDDEVGRVSLNLVERKFLRRLLAGQEIGRAGDLLFPLSVDDPGKSLRLLAETAFPRRKVMAQIYPSERHYALLWVYPFRLLKVLVEGFKQLFWLFTPARPGRF